MAEPRGRLRDDARARSVRIPRQRNGEPSADAVESVDTDPVVVRRSRLAMGMALTFCAAAVLAALAVGASLALRGKPTAAHQVHAPATAAGMHRDPAEERALAGRIGPIRDSFEMQFMGRLNTFVSAVYDHAGKAAGAPSGPIAFVGASVDSSSDSVDFVKAMRDSAEHSGYRAVEVDAGTGASGVCLTPANADGPAASSCAWSTGDSVGEIVATESGWNVDRLGALMRRVRADVESS